MESSWKRKTHLVWWVSPLLVTGWLITVGTAVQWGIGISSASGLIGSSLLALVFIFGGALRAEAKALRRQANIELDSPEASLGKLSWLTGSLIGAGLVLLLQYIVRTIAELAAR